MSKTSLVFAVALVLGQASVAEVLDRQSGIKIGERLTLRPYVTSSITYDSNVDANSGRATKSDKDDFLWTISPSLWLHYNGENWSTILSGFYNYRQYFKRCHRNYNRHEYGQDFRVNWSNSTGAEKGWSLILGESFHQITMANDMIVDGGSYDSDARQFQVAGALQRRFNEHWHADVNSSYYWLDYQNDTKNRAAFYGWDRWLVGGEIGFAPSKWTDLLVSGSYQGYSQDNASGSGYSGDSKGYSVQAGIGSYMTERISYRALAGWSRFEYGDSSSAENGFVYTLSGNWKIGETWNTMLLASSYYQPSERQYASKARIDAVSWGLAKVMVRGQLRATLDVRYRRENHEYVTSGGDDYTLNIWTGRLGLDYSICRMLSVFAYGEYQKSMNDEARAHNDAYDYDRWRLTAGVKLSY